MQGDQTHSSVSTKPAELRPGTSEFRARKAQHGHLIPYEAIEALHAPVQLMGMSSPITIEVDQDVANALAGAVRQNAHDARVMAGTNQHLLHRLERTEQVLRIYRTFVENLADDHIEDMGWQDLQAAAKHLLGIMY